MAVVMGPDGQLINTSNINSGVIGSSLIPDITPNIGALSTIDKPVTNADGTITLPTIEMRSNDPGLEAGQLQKIYGTDLMPYFDWVSTYQTGTMTYDPTDDNSAAELEAINEEFKTKHGISAQDAALKLQMAQAARKSAGALAGQVAGKTAQAMIGGAPSFGEGALAGINSLNPFKGMMGGETAAPAMFGVDGGTRTFTNVQDATAYKNLFPDSKITELPASEQPKDYLASGLQTMRGPEGTSVLDRLYGGSAANMANLKVTGAAAGVDFITQVAMGADPMDAAKEAGKTAVLSYVANAIIPGSGPIIGFLSKFF